MSASYCDRFHATVYISLPINCEKLKNTYSDNVNTRCLILTLFRRSIRTLSVCCRTWKRRKRRCGNTTTGRCPRERTFHFHSCIATSLCSSTHACMSDLQPNSHRPSKFNKTSIQGKTYRWQIDKEAIESPSIFSYMTNPPF